jgi:hypothetical protein
MAARVKTKIIKSAVGAEDVSKLFEEMMGVRDADPALVLPKFVKVRNLLRHIYKVFVQFSSFAPLRANFPQAVEGLDQIKKFAEDLRESVYFNPNTPDETVQQYAELSKSEINAFYCKLKDHNKHVKQLLILGGRLKQYKLYLDDSKNLRDNFIGQEPGLSFMIFNFSSLDLKQLWIDRNMKPIVKTYILNVLHSIWKDTYDVYLTITSPNVDIDKFTTVIMESVANLKKQPGLNNCNNAFRRIEKSVDLLKEKFDTYYRESVSSGNPNIIMESFIIDVSNQGLGDARLTREFRQIIQHLHKVSQESGRSKDPNIQKLFKLVNKNVEAMEKGTTVELDESDTITADDIKSTIAASDTTPDLPDATPAAPDTTPDETS